MPKQGFEPATAVTRAWWDAALTLWEVGVAVPQVMALRAAQLATYVPVTTAGARAPAGAGAVVDAWQTMAMQGLRIHQQLAEQAMGQWWQLWAGALAGGSAHRPPFRATVVPVRGGHARPTTPAARAVVAELLPARRPTPDNVRRLAGPDRAR